MKRLSLEPLRRSLPSKKRALRTRAPLDRMLRIFRRIQAGECPTRKALAEDIEVTVKTVQRDLDFMRDRLLLPIRFDQGRGGYLFTEPLENFPMIDLSEAELVSIYVAQKVMGRLKGTPFEAPLRSAFHKLTSSLTGRLTLAWADLDSLFSSRSFDLAPLDLDVFQAAARAVRTGVEIEFEYRKLDSRKFEKRRLRPYHLACVHDQWYLIGHCLKRDSLRTFVLLRMRALRLTDVKFERPRNFSIERHLRDSFGVFQSDGDFSVKLAFDGFAGQLVRERVWHPSQKIQEHADGGLEISLQLSSLLEIEPWILSWGEHVRVLAPAALRKKIRARHLDAATK